ncbi:hypothetical protein WJX72_005571 [[Myrmecia] bisecta]|uniref:Uncharacterized protein n=1 Tax=[Myrmecia] bisecta TaxID=41462 RepID=A0AAW1PTF7_9CHLO
MHRSRSQRGDAAYQTLTSAYNALNIIPPPSPQSRDVTAGAVACRSKAYDKFAILCPDERPLACKLESAIRSNPDMKVVVMALLQHVARCKQVIADTDSQLKNNAFGVTGGTVRIVDVQAVRVQASREQPGWLMYCIGLEGSVIKSDQGPAIAGSWLNQGPHAVVPAVFLTRTSRSSLRLALHRPVHLEAAGVYMLLPGRHPHSSPLTADVMCARMMISLTALVRVMLDTGSLRVLVAEVMQEIGQSAPQVLQNRELGAVVKKGVLPILVSLGFLSAAGSTFQTFGKRDARNRFVAVELTTCQFPNKGFEAIVSKFHGTRGLAGPEASNPPAPPLSLQPLLDFSALNTVFLAVGTGDAALTATFLPDYLKLPEDGLNPMQHQHRRDRAVAMAHLYQAVLSGPVKQAAMDTGLHFTYHPLIRASSGSFTEMLILSVTLPSRCCFDRLWSGLLRAGPSPADRAEQLDTIYHRTRQLFSVLHQTFRAQHTGEGHEDYAEARATLIFQIYVGIVQPAVAELTRGLRDTSVVMEFKEMVVAMAQSNGRCMLHGCPCQGQRRGPLGAPFTKLRMQALVLLCKTEDARKGKHPTIKTCWKHLHLATPLTLEVLLEVIRMAIVVCRENKRAIMLAHPQTRMVTPNTADFAADAQAVARAICCTYPDTTLESVLLATFKTADRLMGAIFAGIGGVYDSLEEIPAAGSGTPNRHVIAMIRNTLWPVQVEFEQRMSVTALLPGKPCPEAPVYLHCQSVFLGGHLLAVGGTPRAVAAANLVGAVLVTGLDSDEPEVRLEALGGACATQLPVEGQSAVDLGDGRFVVVGGVMLDGRMCHSAYLLSFERGRERACCTVQELYQDPAARPCLRAKAAACYLPGCGIILHGGVDEMGDVLACIWIAVLDLSDPGRPRLRWVCANDGRALGSIGSSGHLIFPTAGGLVAMLAAIAKPGDAPRLWLIHQLHEGGRLGAKALSDKTSWSVPLLGLVELEYHPGGDTVRTIRRARYTGKTRVLDAIQGVLASDMRRLRAMLAAAEAEELADAAEAEDDDAEDQL